jgi:putative FmdB family regulatory protein
MPIYEYNCHKCGKNFEVRQKFSDEPVATHEGCGGEVERLISVPTLQFKGTGWYVTDYGRGSGGSNGKSEPHREHRPAAKSDTKSDTKSESKGEAKTDSKPAVSAAPSPSR